MKWISLFGLFIFLLIFCSACDGHIRSLYLLKPSDPKPSWSMNRATIAIEGNEDLAGIVLQVANELGLKKLETNHWYIETIGKSFFNLRLDKSEQDVWRVILIDFPSISRSEQSKSAEAKILALLKKAQQGR